MASKGVRRDNYCPECGQHFEILNGDFQFSKTLHLQSHKTLETITQEIDQGIKGLHIKQKNTKKSDYTCPECNENVVIFNNDISFSLQLHAQNHKPGHVQGRSDDQSSTSSGKSKKSEKKPQSDGANPPVLIPNILNGIFESMPPGLKLHRGFISESKNGKGLCNICNVTIDSMFNVSEHLKTKLHEDKIVYYLRNMLPGELHHVMEFVSFYGSNLCCNLCRFKIELCSENPYQTLINIIIHNSSKGHLQCKSTEQSMPNYDVARKVLNSLSKVSPLVSCNTHLIECSMQPQFKCKICEKSIAFEKNEQQTFRNFENHFISKGHVKCIEASSVLEAFNLSQFPGKEKHNLIATKGSICCTMCNCTVEVNLQQLISHVNQPLKSELQVNTQTPSEVPVNISLKSLLNSLPPQLRNTNCVVEGPQGQVMCVTCNRYIPNTTQNLASHLFGKSHKSKAEELKLATERKGKKTCNTNTLTDDSGLLKNLFNQIPISLRKHFQFIKVVSKEKLSCSVCSYDLPALNKYLQEHFQSDVHLRSVDTYEFTKFQDLRKKKVTSKNMLENLKKTDVVVKNFSKYLTLDGQQYKCCLCNGKIPHSKIEKNLKTNIICHINGQKHKKGVIEMYDKFLTTVEVTDPGIKDDKPFLQTKQPGCMYCSLCSCDISAATEFGAFKQNILEHLTGSQHNVNKLNMKKINSAPPVKPLSGNSGFNGPVQMDFLKSLPVRFQEDILFIKSTSVDGFLSCTLCNSVVNPQCLKEHFEDLNHVQNKSIRQKTMSTSIEIAEQTLVDNMETMISLLGNIDKKLTL